MSAVPYTSGFLFRFAVFLLCLFTIVHSSHHFLNWPGCLVYNPVITKPERPTLSFTIVIYILDYLEYQLVYLRSPTGVLSHLKLTSIKHSSCSKNPFIPIGDILSRLAPRHLRWTSTASTVLLAWPEEQEQDGSLASGYVKIGGGPR